MNSRRSGLVGSGTNDRTFALPGNDHGLATQLRIIPLLDRSVERVHVAMDDFSHNELAQRVSRAPFCGACDAVEKSANSRVAPFPISPGWSSLRGPWED